MKGSLQERFMVQECHLEEAWGDGTVLYFIASRFWSPNWWKHVDMWKHVVETLVNPRVHLSLCLVFAKLDDWQLKVKTTTKHCLQEK